MIRNYLKRAEIKDPDLNIDGKKFESVIPKRIIPSQRSKTLQYYYRNRDRLLKERRAYAKTPEGKAANQARNKRYRDKLKSKIRYEDTEQ